MSQRLEDLYKENKDIKGRFNSVLNAKLWARLKYVFTGVKEEKTAIHG